MIETISKILARSASKKLVAVYWQDAVSSSSKDNWIEDPIPSSYIEDLLSSSKFISVGFLMYENKNCIAVTSTISNPIRNEWSSGLIIIPRGCILSMGHLSSSTYKKLVQLFNKAG